MLRILIIKTSSLGDVVHMLPAICDAAQCIENIKFDWVVEESFQEVPKWSSTVNRVIPVAIRRWRKSLHSSQTRKEIRVFKKVLQSKTYDIVVDSQGLLKSAVLTRWVKTNNGIWGYDKQSIREPLASYFYQYKVSVSRDLHAIARNRQLLSKALKYSLENLSLNYGLAVNDFPPSALAPSDRYIVALHGTSKVEKEWPTEAWQELVQAMEQQKISVLFPWGNSREKKRAELLSEQSSNALALPKCNLFELARIISNVEAVIGMDTGLMHIAAALNKKGIGLYPITQPKLTGILTSDEDNFIENISGEETSQFNLVIKKMTKLVETF